jgi:hypothetical protein
MESELTNRKGTVRDSAFAVNALAMTSLGIGEFWWRFTDSNRGPVDYDSIALTD